MQDHSIDNNTVTIHVVRRNGDKHDVKVDLIDWQWIKNYTVGIKDSGKGLYAIIYTSNGQQLLHRVIKQASKEEQVDHALDTLNNCQINLTVCSNAENGQNRHGSYSSSGERGVYWHAPTGKWRANAQVKGIRHHLGLFPTIEAAATVIKAFRAEHMPFSKEAREVV